MPHSLALSGPYNCKPDKASLTKPYREGQAQDLLGSSVGKALVPRPEGLNSILREHMAEGKNLFLQIVI